MRWVDSTASTVFGARLRVRGRLPEVLLVPLAFIRNAVIGALGLGGDRVAPAQVEVFRLSDGALVGGIPAGSGYQEQTELLDAVQRALGTRSTTDFLEAWGLNDRG